MDIIKNSQTRKDMTLTNIESQCASELTKIEQALQLRENSGFSNCTAGIANPDMRDKITYYLLSKGYKVEDTSSSVIKITW